MAPPPTADRLPTPAAWMVVATVRPPVATPALTVAVRPVLAAGPGGGTRSCGSLPPAPGRVGTGGVRTAPEPDAPDRVAGGAAPPGPGATGSPGKANAERRPLLRAM